MSQKSLICAQIADWLLELVPVWEVPVTASMLHCAYPEATKQAIVNALKFLTDGEVLYTTIDLKDRVFYQPVAQRKLCDIQVLICGGKLDE